MILKLLCDVVSDYFDEDKEVEEFEDPPADIFGMSGRHQESNVPLRPQRADSKLPRSQLRIRPEEQRTAVLDLDDTTRQDERLQDSDVLGSLRAAVSAERMKVERHKSNISSLVSEEVSPHQKDHAHTKKVTTKSQGFSKLKYLQSRQEVVASDQGVTPKVLSNYILDI